MLALKYLGTQAELEAWWHKKQQEDFSDQNYAEHTEIDSGHGRIETRTCHQMLIDKKWQGKEYRWSGFKNIIKIMSEVHDKSTGKNTSEIRWYILNAEQCLHAVRSHWLGARYDIQRR